jgi:hypothetical protein
MSKCMEGLQQLTRPEMPLQSTASEARLGLEFNF